MLHGLALPFQFKAPQHRSEPVECAPSSAQLLQTLKEQNSDAYWSNTAKITELGMQLLSKQNVKSHLTQAIEDLRSGELSTPRDEELMHAVVSSIQEKTDFVERWQELDPKLNPTKRDPQFSFIVNDQVLPGAVGTYIPKTKEIALSPKQAHINPVFMTVRALALGLSRTHEAYLQRNKSFHPFLRLAKMFPILLAPDFANFAQSGGTTYAHEVTHDDSFKLKTPKSLPPINWYTKNSPAELMLDNFRRYAERFLTIDQNSDLAKIYQPRNIALYEVIARISQCYYMGQELSIKGMTDELKQYAEEFDLYRRVRDAGLLDDGFVESAAEILCAMRGLGENPRQIAIRLRGVFIYDNPEALQSNEACLHVLKEELLDLAKRRGKISTTEITVPDKLITQLRRKAVLDSERDSLLLHQAVLDGIIKHYHNESNAISNPVKGHHLN